MRYPLLLCSGREQEGNGVLFQQRYNPQPPPDTEPKHDNYKNLSEMCAQRGGSTGELRGPAGGGRERKDQNEGGKEQRASAVEQTAYETSKFLEVSLSLSLSLFLSYSLSLSLSAYLYAYLSLPLGTSLPLYVSLPPYTYTYTHTHTHTHTHTTGLSWRSSCSIFVYVYVFCASTCTCECVESERDRERERDPRYRGTEINHFLG